MFHFGVESAFVEPADLPMRDPLSELCQHYFEIAKVYEVPHKGYLIQIYNNARYGLLHGTPEAQLSIVRFFAKTIPRREYLDVLRRIMQENHEVFKAVLTWNSHFADELRKLLAYIK